MRIIEIGSRQYCFIATDAGATGTATRLAGEFQLASPEKMSKLTALEERPSQCLPAEAAPPADSLPGLPLLCLHRICRRLTRREIYKLCAVCRTLAGLRCQLLAEQPCRLLGWLQVPIQGWRELPPRLQESTKVVWMQDGSCLVIDHKYACPSLEAVAERVIPAEHGSGRFWLLGAYGPPLVAGSDAFAYPASPSSRFLAIEMMGQALNLATGQLTQVGVIFGFWGA
jgi:hypothetical protein